MKSEGSFKTGVLKRIRERFPDCVISKMDAGYLQGFPDALILLGEKWAALEFKKTKNATHRPNQDWWVDKLDAMSYSAFIYPENEEEILDALFRFFET